MFGFKIGFLDFSFFDILDVLLVAILLYQVYKLLRGSIAFNIFMGMLLVYMMWFIVRMLDMELLGGIIGNFIEVGVIALLIVFQPEVRKFLLFLGRSSRFSRYNNYLKTLLGKDKRKPVFDYQLQEILTAITDFQKSRTGAILVISTTSRLQFYANTGVAIDGYISAKLLESIFEKNSPLHDGAVIIADSRIIAAGCVLPVSDNPDLPSRLGLRHRATVGITEHSDALAVVVSEETGEIAYARNGELYQNVSIPELEGILFRFFES
ncbi:MAG: membrane protein [Chitinophagales bacterium]|nr:MAG: membrane protein [Chitinophagales bacterium]